MEWLNVAGNGAFSDFPVPPPAEGESEEEEEDESATETKKNSDEVRPLKTVGGFCLWAN